MMKIQEARKEIKVLADLESEYSSLNALLRVIKVQSEESRIEPDEKYVKNINRRMVEILGRFHLILNKNS